MPEPSPFDFDKILKSGLVSTEQLRKTMDQLIAINEPVSSASVLKQLWHVGILSKWQTEQLQAGRYKGFFLRNYVILKLTHPQSKSYLAEALNTKTGKYVSLSVTRSTTLLVEETCMLSCDPRDGLRLVSDEARLRRSDLGS